jgi:hypothetical protein
MKNLPRLQLLLMVFTVILCMIECTKEKPKPTPAEIIIIEKAKIDSIQQTQKKLSNEKANIPFIYSDSARKAYWK